jgi:hypothetical protein
MFGIALSPGLLAAPLGPFAAMVLPDIGPDFHDNATLIQNGCRLVVQRVRLPAARFDLMTGTNRRTMFR